MKQQQMELKLLMNMQNDAGVSREKKVIDMFLKP